jgi:cytochrome c5
MNQSKRRNALTVTFVLTVIVGAIAAPPRSYSKAQGESGQLSPADAKKLKSPVPFSKESIAKGKTIFARYCTECHGTDGKAQVDVIANATDLTDPALWKNGTSEGEAFKSIRDGAGMSMPSFKTQIHKEEDLWHLVNFVRSLWPESVRPKLP